MRVKTICSSPAGDFCDIKESLSDCGVVHPMGGHTSLQSEQREGRAQWGKARLGFAAPAACSWSMGPWELLPSGTIWCQGRHLSSLSQGASQQLSTLLVYREETHCTRPSGLIWLELKSADPNLAKRPWISLSAYLRWPSGLGPRGTLIHKANKHVAKFWFRKI